MEKFKINDFNTAFQIGIEKMVLDAIKSNSKDKSKLPEKLKLKKILKIVKHDIFVRIYTIVMKW